MAATWVAGFVDTIGFLVLSRILAANMSGNTVRLGVNFAQVTWDEVLRRGWPVLMFVCGLVLSALILEGAGRRGFRSGTSLTLGLESLLIATFIWVGGPTMMNGVAHPATNWGFNTLVGLLAVAMGLQNATITRVGALSVKTTHVTGTLTKMAELFARYIVWFYDRTRGRFRRRVGKVLRVSPRQRSVQGATFMAGLWVAFALGATCAAYTKNRMELRCLVFPIAISLMLVIIDLCHPILASEELLNPREE